ncbi:MAG: IMPACT family protein [Bacteroidota bacterium]
MPYRTVAREASSRIVVCRSVFIAYVREVGSETETRAFLHTIKASEPKADHHCFAYRLGEGKAAMVHAADDGEPSGSAGRPILGALLSAGVTNTMAVVARYFGGKKLGIPGLIEAYRAVTIEALSQAGAVDREHCCGFVLPVPYDRLDSARHLIRGLGGRECGVAYGAVVTVRFEIPVQARAAVLSALAGLGLTPAWTGDGH